jgi:hypothetical protein
LEPVKTTPTERFASIDEALSTLLPEPEPEPVGPSIVPVTHDPWPKGRQLVEGVLGQVGERVSRALSDE